MALESFDSFFNQFIAEVGATDNSEDVHEWVYEMSQQFIDEQKQKIMNAPKTTHIHSMNIGISSQIRRNRSNKHTPMIPSLPSNQNSSFMTQTPHRMYYKIIYYKIIYYKILYNVSRKYLVFFHNIYILSTFLRLFDFVVI